MTLIIAILAVYCTYLASFFSPICVLSCALLYQTAHRAVECCAYCVCCPPPSHSTHFHFPNCVPSSPSSPLSPLSSPNPQRPGSRWLGCISGRGSASGHRQGPCPTNRLPGRPVPSHPAPAKWSRVWDVVGCISVHSTSCVANQTRYHSPFETPFFHIFTHFLGK
jgi:hypothetical protein